MPDITYTPNWKRQRPSASGLGGLVDEGGTFTVTYADGRAESYSDWALPGNLRAEYERQRWAAQELAQSQRKDRA